MTRYVAKAEVALAYALEAPPYEALHLDVESDIGQTLGGLTLVELDHVADAARRLSDVARYLRVTRYAEQQKGASNDRVAAPDPAPGG